MRSKLSDWRSFSLLVLAVILLAACTGAATGEDIVEVPPPSGAAANESPISSVVALHDAEDDDEQTVQLIGAVQYVDGDALGINGLSVNFSNASTDGDVVTGAIVQIQGREVRSGVVAADFIWVLQPPAEPTATAVPVTSAIPVVIEGPVQAISGNRVRVHGIDFELDDDPRLQGIQVGDVLRIGGEIDDDRMDDLFDDASDDDIDDDRYVSVRNTQIGFLSNEIYANADGQVWRDSGSCAGAPPGWASANAWRSRCSGEFGGGPPATGANSPSGTGSSGATGTGASAPAGAGASDASGDESPPAPPPPPPPPQPPPAGGGGDSSSGSNSGSSS